MSTGEREKLRAEESVLLQRVATLNRGKAAAELEEDSRAAEREGARLQAEAARPLPSGGGVATLAPVEVKRHDFDGEIAELKAQADDLGVQIGEGAVADAPPLLEDLAKKTEAARATHAALGETAIPLFIAVLAADRLRAESLAAVAAVLRDFRGNPKAVFAQKEAVKRYCRDLLDGASQAEICGLFVYQLLTWSRRGGSALGPTWEKHNISALEGSVRTHQPAIGGVVAGGSLPL